MKLISTPIGGVYLIELGHFTDDRGSLTKIYTETIFEKNGLPTYFPEHFFSSSNQNVIRGMHGQSAHTECGKLVYVPVGRVLDVALDMRPESPTYQNFFQTELSADNHTAIYIPEGCLHGFKTLEDHTHTVYFQTKMRDPNFECGIRYDSFGMNWGSENTIVSERDRTLPTLEEYSATLVTGALTSHS